MKNTNTQKAIGLYDPRNEHDACGTGFVASVDGKSTHQIIQWAVQCVCNVTHRGAVAADAKTGDGAGILTQIPHALFKPILEGLGVRSAKANHYGVGMLFLPSDDLARAEAEGIIEGAVKSRSFDIIGWRDVPVDPAVLGDQARQSLPVIKQIFIQRPEGMDLTVFERQLFIVRHRIEKAWKRKGCVDCYIPSFSAKTICYKGMLVAPQLLTFYEDIQNPLYASAIVVFHQRYSTNTFPNWFLAQPFRLMSHNGEINTLRGNRNWMAAREPELSSELWGDDLHELFPIIQEDGSDSMSLDNVFELLIMSGWDPLHAMMMLVPDAWQAMRGIDPKVLAFYQYHAMLCEPWDGPAALTFTDGNIVGASLDRNGLRPARYWITDDNIVILASEVGVVNIPQERIIEKGRLGPGQILGVDTVAGRILRNDDLKAKYASEAPYEDWVKDSYFALNDLMKAVRFEELTVDAGELLREQVAHGFTDEELTMILKPMVVNGKEPVLSMGDDIPLAVLSNAGRSLFSYFKQLFAQVTNPPIDPIREELVMSLNTLIGARPNMFSRGAAKQRLLMIKSPLLLPKEIEAIRNSKDSDVKPAEIPILFKVAHGPGALRSAVESVCERVLHAVEKGATAIILSDTGVDKEHAPIPSLMAVSAVHHSLIRNHRRMRASIIIEAGDVHDVHQVACLIGFGAAAVYPHLAVKTIKQQHDEGKYEGVTFDQALAKYRKAVNLGVLKIMSKMGISTVGSYRGAQIFEALGIGEELIEKCFPGTASRIGGVNFEQVAETTLKWHKAAYHVQGPLVREPGGIYRFMRGGEYHDYNPEVVRLLQQAVKTGNYEIFKKFTEKVHSRPAVSLRDLLDFKPLGPAVPVEEVESVEAITKRFVTANISYGALSLEAHETLAAAMNRIGGRSGSGEGGEDPARYRNIDPEYNRCSKIKQVASGRFGVTPEYLMSAEQLEIKMAQGAKPGEGGQLPGHKVSVEIARVRHTIPGVTLISPPPHHDIYSIEDLAQLIYDLKMINPDAKVIVKLVSEAGVGTIAAGVAKGYADVILIAGYDGGTGASPISSIKNAGLPWELGVAETQQTLRLNSLRRRIILRSDGGMKTGRDVISAALLGSEEYGFGTMPLVATGCIMTRKCHLNTCPVGVATQQEQLRARFKGNTDMVVNYMRFVAQHVREYLAALGARSLDEIIGRTELLTRKSDVKSGSAHLINLDYLLTRVNVGERIHTQERNDREDDPLDNQIIKDAKAALEGRGKVSLQYKIHNTDRTVGARLAGKIAKQYTDEGLPEGTIDIQLDGVAGQSFGAFCINGMRMTLTGEANDYVGKGMHGGELIIRPPQEVSYAWHKNGIIGNTCLYGATGGVLYAAGLAGERFAVRNSGASAVVEGVGDHGCEYMTGGHVVVLGETGRNFGAGMTGGLAYVLDLEDAFENKVNLELVRIERLNIQEDKDTIRTMLERHFVATKSPRALEVMSNWDDFESKFWVVVPRESGARLERAVSMKEG